MYFIGDVHNNIQELKKLLATLNLSGGAELVFLGDYIDKNTSTQETVEFLLSLCQEYHCVFLKGNHDFVWDRYLNHQEYARQEFLLKYGSAESLRQYSGSPEVLIKNNDVAAIKVFFRDYLKLLALTQDYFLADSYLAVHAGLSPDQLNQQPLVWSELNYFLRPKRMVLDKKYLGTHAVVAGHTFLSDTPTIYPGYINVDLGAGYGQYLGALSTEDNAVIRSDGKIFTLNI
ncbi:MAG: metallophosphoesterase [Candidatus Magasanikbacteria bacterium]|nr:metallophosphoesterase [Candidatus Magasanikbacteria bacterium]